MKQLSFFPEADSQIIPVETTNCHERRCIEKKFSPIMREELRLGKLVAYGGNKAIPLLSLFRYKEAFAFGFVKEFIHRFSLSSDDYLFDPFCGMGTTLFTAMQHNVPAIGIDRLPIATFIAQTLPLFYSLEPQEIRETFQTIRAGLNQAEPAEIADDVAIMKDAFDRDNLLALRCWKSEIEKLPSPMKDIFMLVFLAILEPCSYTAKDGQFLRLNRDKLIAEPDEMLQQKVYEVEKDILSLRYLWGDKKPLHMPVVQMGDARDLSNVHFEKPPTAIITSPPYANRYDYTRTYSLELCFNFVKNFEELKALRFGILRSHIESKVNPTDQPPHPVIKEVVDILRQRKLNNPRIPDMLTAYFVDMRKVIGEWAKVLTKGGKVAMVVDNVRFDGEMVPVDLVLSEMAEEVGFKIEQVIVARYKGNSSQQMGKYGRVPVRESIVIWQKQ
ncbi:site-specific DNA-methyltransferase [Microseira wollei]|uniref:site-specific DNA-methyltransferase (cytosine-N(4)-specific) n=1 Tax=Microseira wollei NIES-4236 TaxID=2530354 RepID=A0AAV3XSN1_9CYAN|nr:site-specific DNA-methyltransferase [Microseira wollei]GET44099.1 site-specific DNA-methyltransferase (cytosine-specific) [Microseira wollei NIES-4236]